ncbi:MAG TPA: glutaredoxin family protein [Rhodanobacteraceae bacterium]
MLTLYQRDDCKLCDEAVALLARLHAPDFESVWIDDDADLEARYGERVPVLRDETRGRELQWPFDAEALRAFLGQELQPPVNTDRS